MLRPVKQHRRGTDRTRLGGTNFLDSANKLPVVDQLDPNLGRLGDRRLGEVRQGHEYARLAREPFSHQRTRKLAYLVDADGPRLPALALHEQLLSGATASKARFILSIATTWVD